MSLRSIALLLGEGGMANFFVTESILRWFCPDVDCLKGVATCRSLETAIEAFYVFLNYFFTSL